MAHPIKILIIGSGFGGVYTLKNLHKIFHKNKNIEISMIGEKNYFLFTPLLHEVATGGINAGNIIEPIRTILGCCLKNFYLGKAELINTTNKTVGFRGIELSYDYLVLAPGAQTNFYNTKGAAENSFSLKSLEDAINIKNQCLIKMECALHAKDKIEQKRKLSFVIVGGGPTGVELAAEIQELITENFSHYYSKELISESSVILIQKASELTPQFGAKMRQKSLEVLRQKGVKVILNTEVKEIGADFVKLGDDTEIPTETVIWVAGIKPNALNFDKQVEQSPLGHLIINEYLQLKDNSEIFAIGDIALLKDKKTDKYFPALAQVAEKQALYAANNIEKLIRNKALMPFNYKSSGTLVSLGEWMAVGEVSGFTFSGRIAWWFWRTVYLFKLISLRKKFRVAFDWTINLFYPRDISQF